MRFSIRTLFKNIIGFLLLPITIICVISFFSVLITIKWHLYPTYLFIIGFIVYFFLYVLNKNKSFSYVLGHEISHAIISLLFGGKLLSIFVSHKNGSVSTTKDNFIISLIPYCIPFYAVVLSIIYYVLSIFINTRPLLPLFIFLLGISLSHHCMLTIHYINIGQHDIFSQGSLFSFSIILLLNAITITIIMGFFLKQVPIVSFWQKIIESLKILFSELKSYNY